MVNQAAVPNWKNLFWPLLKAVEALGGSGSIQEIEPKAAEFAGVTREQQAVPHKGGRYTELNYRLAWCRTYLKGLGYLDTNGRGVWSITEEGRKAVEADMATVEVRYRELHPRQGETTLPPNEEPGEAAEVASEQTWRDELLGCLLRMPPDRFEHLVQHGANSLRY
jgi:restriction system protein